MTDDPIAVMRPFQFRRTTDYAYGLALADMALNAQSADAFSLTMIMHNAADGPICYQFEKIDFKINGCILASKEPPKHRSVIVSRGMNSMYPCPPLKRMAITALPQMSGKLHIAAMYGHPDELPCRRVEWEIAPMLVIAPPQPRISMNMESQSEIALNETLQ